MLAASRLSRSLPDPVVEIAGTSAKPLREAFASLCPDWLSLCADAVPIAPAARTATAARIRNRLIGYLRKSAYGAGREDARVNPILDMSIASPARFQTCGRGLGFLERARTELGCRRKRLAKWCIAHAPLARALIRPDSSAPICVPDGNVLSDGPDRDRGPSAPRTPPTLRATVPNVTAIALPAGHRTALFGMRARAPKPYLLMIVFGVLLVIVGVTATAQTVLVSLHISTASLNATVASDAATVRTFVNGLVQPDDLRGLAAPDRVATVGKGLGSLAERGQILRIEIRDPAGVVRLSSEPSGGRRQLGRERGLRSSRVRVRRCDADRERASRAKRSARQFPRPYLLREYLPLMGADGTTQGVVGIWRDAGPILTAIDKVRGDVLLVTLSAAAIVALILFLVFRAAQRRITRPDPAAPGIAAARRLDRAAEPRRGRR